MIATKMEPGINEERYTQKILTQLMALGVVIIVIGLWQADFLLAVYARNQLTHVGWFINGGILVLFLAGIYHLVREFRRLSAEERSISQLLANMRDHRGATEGADPDSLIVQRYHTLQDLHRQHSAINHSALAATLVALESSRVSFPKFVHNVLILTGVFGTIVSSVPIVLIATTKGLDTGALAALGFDGLDEMVAELGPTGAARAIADAWRSSLEAGHEPMTAAAWKRWCAGDVDSQDCESDAEDESDASED